MKAKEVLDTDYVKIDKSAAISELIGLLEKTHQKAALVFDKKKYIGISHKNLLLKTKLDPAKFKVAKVIAHVPILNGEEDIAEVARLLYTSDSPLLPVIKKSTLLGVVKSIKLIIQIKQMPEQRRKKASEIMTAEPISVNENDRTGKAIEIMRENHISRIPIVDKKGNLLNITSFTDILRQYHLRQQGSSEYGHSSPGGQTQVKTTSFEAEKTDIHSYPIKNLTSPIMITAKEDDNVSEIIDLMNEYEISSLVIIKDKKSVGIVTVRDLLKLLMPEAVTY